jgi:hypothetical protein
MLLPPSYRGSSIIRVQYEYRGAIGLCAGHEVTRLLFHNYRFGKDARVGLTTACKY